MYQNNMRVRHRRTQFCGGIAGVLLACVTVAQEPEEVVAVGQRVYPASELTAPAALDSVDTAELLQRLPGANFNRNGTLTGIAQYRGLYGDRVNVTINGLSAVTGGPNAMDAPLSYASPLLLEHLTIERGIASVWASTESIGGHIDAEYDRGQYATTNEFEVSGDVRTRYEQNGRTSSTGLRLVGSNDAHRITLLAERDRAEDFEFPDGTLTPTRLNRKHYDLSYGYRGDGISVTVFAGALDTTDSGTPALPMDIGFIDTTMYGTSIAKTLEKSTLDIAISRMDVDHEMDNFSLRTPPPTGMAYRTNRARGEGSRWKIGNRTVFDRGELRVGVDGEASTHTARITNPNVAPFYIDNFNDAERDIIGIYGQWNQPVARFDIETGLRLNRVSMNSGPVAAGIPPMNPMMQMMGMNAANLADAFNASELNKDRNNVDVVFKIGRVLDSGSTIYLETAQKSRAPSYQEAYLWLPMQSTGGLADGRSYIGNPGLASEESHEINLGMDWRAEKAWFAPQIFFKDVDDYIQGVPSANPVANMVSMMMTGMPALEFANTDAELYGMDLGWGYSLNGWISVEGTLTYVRGQRTDIDDNLYRLAPLNGRMSLMLDRMNWSAQFELMAYSSQSRVSSYNNELPSAGYGVVNARAQWVTTPSLELSASIENVFDKTYRPHLGGINRVANVDVLVGDRLPDFGRSVNLGLAYSW